MKKIIVASLSVLLFVAFVIAPAAVRAQTPTPQPGEKFTGDQIVIANTYRLESGDILEGNLLVVGGTATIAKDAVLTGDVILVGGTMSVSGTINGKVIAIGGVSNIEDYAVVNGDMTLIGASLKRSPLSQINGDITEQTPKILDFNFKNPSGLKLPFTTDTNPMASVLRIALQSLTMGILAVILGLLLPEQIKRVAETITHEPLIAGGVGLLSLLATPVIVVLLCLTFILIPIAALVLMVLALAVLFGWIALGYEIGVRIGGLFKTTWHPAIASGIGVLLIALVTGYSSFIFCGGLLIGIILGLFGLGGVVISRFGSSKFVNKVAEAVMPPQQPGTPANTLKP